jgi:hypothetical protein
VASTDAVAEPEVLSLGPTPRPPRRPRRGSVAVVVILIVLATMAGGWWLWLKPAPDFTLEALQDVYSGMVRSDGLNDLYTLEPGTIPEGEPMTVAPAECAPLFDTTEYNQFPSDAVDGVSTYWFGDPTTVSLLTVRYPDRSTARGAYAAVKSAMDACSESSIRLRTDRQAFRVIPTEAMAVLGSDNHLGYTYSTQPRSRFAIHVMRYANTITWQFRHDSSATSYSALPATQLMTSLVTQMRAVQDQL